MIHYLILLILLLALLAGCTAPLATSPTTPVVSSPAPDTTTAPQPALPTSPPAAESVTATAPVTDSPAVTTAPAGEMQAETAAQPDWLAEAQVYRDETVGFELHYPAGWDLIDLAPEVKQEGMGYAVTLNSWPRQPGSGGIPEGGTKLDIIVTRSAPASPMDAAAIRRDELALDPANPTVTNESTTTLGTGLPATRWEVEAEGYHAVEFVTATNGYTVLLSGLGDFALVEEIVRTLQPFQ